MEQPTAEQLRERRAALAAALRSGNYRQGKSCLTRIGLSREFDCCLGVSCKLAMSAGLKLKVVRPRCDDDDEECERSVKYDGREDFMPDSVRRFYGFKTCNGDYGTADEDGDFESLAKMNDEGKSFSEIADFIESNPPGLWEESTARSEA